VAEVFVVGSVNQDFVLKVERRPRPGETVTGAKLLGHPGGKGANQAVGAALLGARVALLGRVGTDAFGNALVQNLREKGVETTWIKASPEARTGAAFITVTPDGENAIIVAPGANLHLTPDDVDGISEYIGRARILVSQMEIPIKTVRRAVEVASSHGTRVMLNLSPAQEFPGHLFRCLDPLVVNEHEASFLLGRLVTDRVVGGLEAAEELLTLGPRSVVVTLGAAGAVVASEEGAKHHPAPKVPVVDTTGAGDAFVGALAARLIDDATLGRAVDYAVLAAATAVTKEGAQDELPTAEAVILTPPDHLTF
jgi:ribokinase